MTHVPILIVGAGPSGLMMACELARHEIPFRIIDKKPERTLTSNAAGIQTRTLEIFNHIGVLDRFIRKGLMCKGINIHTARAVTHIGFDHLDSLYHYILMLPQADTEAILIQRLQEYGHHVERAVELVNITETKEQYTVQLQDMSVESQVLSVDYIVACDGAHSKVRSLFGLQFAGEDIDEQFIVADATMDAFLRDNEVHVFNQQGKAFGVFPLGERCYRLAANLDLRYPRKFFTEKEVKEIVIDRGRGEFSAESVVWISPFWIHSKMLDQFRVGNVFFVGDAAHIHSPMGAQGMNTGIQDAYNLAWKLALVYRKRAQSALLDSYQNERMPIVRQIVLETDRMTRVMVSNSHVVGILRSVLFFVLRHVRVLRDKLSRRVTQLAICYDNSHVIDNKNKINSILRPGARLPDVAITTAKRLHDYFKNTKHQIIFFSGQRYTQSTLDHLMELQAWVTSHYPDLACPFLVVNDASLIANHVIYDADNKVHAHFAVEKSAICIVRPDMYIGACSTQVNELFITAYFNKLLSAI